MSYKFGDRIVVGENKTHSPIGNATVVVAGVWHENDESETVLYIKDYDWSRSLPDAPPSFDDALRSFNYFGAMAKDVTLRSGHE